jgi:hypothetical protein
VIRTTLLGEGNITLRGCCFSGVFDGLCGRKKINEMKKVLSVLAVSILFFATGCKKEGCTNQDATNYSSEADDDDGSCSFEGEVVFWYGESVANGLVAIGSTTLTFMVDGVIVGSTASNVFWTAAPNCGQNGSITVSRGLGNATNLAGNYSVKDQDNFEIWAGVLNFTANTCTVLELSE